MSSNNSNNIPVLKNPTDLIGAEPGASGASTASSGVAGIAATAEGTDAGRTISSTDVVPRAKRFRWQYKTTEMCFNPISKSYDRIYPFLDDNNEHDFLFTQLLLSEAPDRVGYGNKVKVWIDFNNKMMECKASDGSFPFKHIGKATAHSRYTKYQEVVLFWTDKTTGARQVPALKADGIAFSSEDDDEYDVSTGVGSREIAKQIRDAIIEIFESKSIADAEREKGRLITADDDAKRSAVVKRTLPVHETSDAKRLAVEERKLSAHEMNEKKRLAVEERKLLMQEKNDAKRLDVEDRKLSIQEKQIQMQADMIKQQSEMLKMLMEQLAKKN